MANWGNLVEVVNRTSKPLNVRWDGKDVTLDPNYTAEGELIQGARNMVPPHIVEFAMNQNIKMGTEDPLDPSLAAAVCLIGQVGVDDCSFCEQSECPTRVDLASYLGDANLKIHQGRGPHKNAEAAVGAPGGANGGSILARAV